VRLAVLVLLLSGSSCAIGAGALTASGRSALVRNSDRSNAPVMVGAYAGALPSATFTFPENTPMATGFGWAAQAGANLYIYGIGGTVEYEYRWDDADWAGRLHGGSQTHGVMGFFSIAPFPVLSFDVGAGGLFQGKFGMLNRCGTVLQDCDSGYVGDASGVRVAGRINLSIFGPSSFWGMLYGSHYNPSTGLMERTSGEGPIIPITTSLRLEVGYQRLEVKGPEALPKSVGALNIGVQLLFGLF
jgi:hypothetical protein